MGEYPRIPSSPMEFRKNERGISLGSRRFIPLHTLDALISERRYSLHSRELCTQLGARETTEHTHSERAKAILGYDDLQYCKAELRGDEGSLRENRLIGWHTGNARKRPYSKLRRIRRKMSSSSEARLLYISLSGFPQILEHANLQHRGWWRAPRGIRVGT